MKKFMAFLFVALFWQNCFASTVVKTDDLGNGLSYKEVSTKLLEIEKQTKIKDIDVGELVDFIP